MNPPLNGKKISLIIAVAFIVSGCVGKNYWKHNEIKPINHQQVESQSDPNQYLIQTLKMFKNDWNKYRVKDFDCFYIPRDMKSFGIDNVDEVLYRLLEGTISGAEVFLSIDQQEYDNWVDFSTLEQVLSVKYQPIRSSDLSRKVKTRKERGMLIQTSRIYHKQGQGKYFVVMIGLREYELDPSGQVMSEYIEASGSRFKNQFFVWIDDEGQSFVRNISI